MAPVSRTAGIAAWVVALGSTGCNVMLHAKGGGVAAAADETLYGGAEANAGLDVDVAQGTERVAPEDLPETATRFGPTGGAYVRGTGLGFGAGGRAGFFAGSTDADKLFRGSVEAETGMQVVGGSAYGLAGAVGTVTFGVAVAKSYDAASAAHCRSLAYLTISAQGMFDYVPDPGVFAPGAALLIGVATLDDGGAPSDRGAPEARCPR